MPKCPKGESLTRRQDRFCNEFIIDLNGTKAAERAGYSKKTAGFIACENLKKPNIQARIAYLQEERAKRTQITQDYVINGFRTVAERCMQEVPVMAMERGELVETGEFKFDSSGANTAYTRLGQHLGIFKERGSPEDPVNVIMKCVFGDKNLKGSEDA